MARPPDSDAGPRVRVSYRLRPETVATAEVVAESAGRTVTDVLEDAIAEHGRRRLGGRLAELVRAKLDAAADGA